MRYSLVSRSQGTVLGAILGEIVLSRINQNVETVHIKPPHWSQIAVLGAESLIKTGTFDVEDWHKRQQEHGICLEKSYSKILATLPVVLFSHENVIKLRQNLLLVAKIWEYDPVVRDGMLAVGYAIAQSLTEKLASTTLIHQTISFLGETTTKLPQKLLQVNQLLESGAGLERAQSELSREEKLSYAVAMAFYCFLSTIEDFRLSVLRAHQNSTPTAGAITGALSGAYNSKVGIPITWQVLLEQPTAAKWKLTSSHMLQLTDALVAVWSGVYDLAPRVTEVSEERRAVGQSNSSFQAIAAPHVIRWR